MARNVVIWIHPLSKRFASYCDRKLGKPCRFSRHWLAPVVARHHRLSVALTHRIAISNRRLLAREQDTPVFSAVSIFLTIRDVSRQGPRNATAPRHRPNDGPGIGVIGFLWAPTILCAGRIRNGEKAVADLRDRRDWRRAYLAPTAVTRDLAASRIGDATTGARTARTAVTVESGAMSRPSGCACASDVGCAAR